MNKLLFLSTFLLFALGLKSQNYKAEISAMDKYIEQGRKDWHIPGMAVAIIKDGKVLLAKGYGEKELGSGKMVDNKTVFNIGSTTKAFTAVLVGMLVDEGKVDWDDPVIAHLPSFQLYDADATRKARVKDLLTHNLGLGNADYLWANAIFSPREILYRMRFLKPSYAFRGGYTYQNIMYLAAGLLIEEKTGKSWEQNIEERIFQPLGMKDSYANKALSQVETNRSIAHHWAGEKIIPIEDFNCDSIAAAGAIWSCIDDMAKWSMFMLDTARVNGKALLSKDTWAALFKPHTIIPENQFYPTTALTNPRWTTYGLAWFQHEYFGKILDFHTGSLPGTMALHGLIHEDKVGYYFLGNLDHAELRHALMYKTFDVFANTGNDRDWSKDLKQLYDGFNLAGEKNRKAYEAQRVPNTVPTKKLEAYVGTYEHKVWGQLKVSMVNNQLQIKNGQGEITLLEHRHFDTFKIKPIAAWQFPSYVNFEMDMMGNITKLVMSEAYTFNRATK